jgi:uncharacterized protein
MVLLNFILLIILQSDFATAESYIHTVTGQNSINLNLPTLIFIHGSPGDYTAFKKYLEDSNLKSKFNLIAIDRPGYGKSTRFKKQISMPEQAQLILKKLNSLFDSNTYKQDIILVGHSYGSPLATLLNNDKIKPKSLVLISGPYNPLYNMIRWYNHLARFSLIEIVIGSFWRTSNQEMLKIPEDLKTVEIALSQFDGATYFVHGTKDKIVPFKHSKWAHEQRVKSNKSSQLIEIKSNHFLVWSKYETVKKLLLELP